MQVYIMYNPSRPVQHHVHLITIRRTPVSYIMYIIVHHVQSITVESAHIQVYIVHTHQDQKYMALVVSFIYRLLFQGRKFTLHNPSRSRAHVSEVHVFRCVIVYSPRRSKVLCTGSWLKPGRDVMLTPLIFTSQDAKPNAS